MEPTTEKQVQFPTDLLKSMYPKLLTENPEASDDWRKGFCDAFNNVRLNVRSIEVSGAYRGGYLCGASLRDRENEIVSSCEKLRKELDPYPREILQGVAYTAEHWNSTWIEAPEFVSADPQRYTRRCKAVIDKDDVEIVYCHGTNIRTKIARAVYPCNGELIRGYVTCEIEPDKRYRFIAYSKFILVHRSKEGEITLEEQWGENPQSIFNAGISPDVVHIETVGHRAGRFFGDLKNTLRKHLSGYPITSPDGAKSLHGKRGQNLKMTKVTIEVTQAIINDSFQRGMENNCIANAVNVHLHSDYYAHCVDEMILIVQRGKNSGYVYDTPLPTQEALILARTWDIPDCWPITFEIDIPTKMLKKKGGA